jgi:hypothetical protein
MAEEGEKEGIKRGTRKGRKSLLLKLFCSIDWFFPAYFHRLQTIPSTYPMYMG